MNPDDIRHFPSAPPRMQSIGETPLPDITYYQWLVGMALQGLIASNSYSPCDIAGMAEDYADDTIAILEQRRK